MSAVEGLVCSYRHVVGLPMYVPLLLASFSELLRMYTYIGAINWPPKKEIFRVMCSTIASSCRPDYYSFIWYWFTNKLTFHGKQAKYEGQYDHSWTMHCLHVVPTIYIIRNVFTVFRMCICMFNKRNCTLVFGDILYDMHWVHRASWLHYPGSDTARD